MQLGHTTAAAVVEAFGTVDALYPGRLDLGLGRSGQRRAEALKAVAERNNQPTPPRRETEIRDGVVIPAPFDPSGLLLSPRLAAAQSVLQQPGALSPAFDQQVDDILALLGGTYSTPDGIERCRDHDAVPPLTRPSEPEVQATRVQRVDGAERLDDGRCGGVAQLHRGGADPERAGRRGQDPDEHGR